MTRPLSIGTAYANKAKAGPYRPQGKRIYRRCPWCLSLSAELDVECRSCTRERRAA